jgi:hypothetical protein
MLLGGIVNKVIVGGGAIGVYNVYLEEVATFLFHFQSS